MESPNDFGFTPAETLAHTARATRPPGFGQFFDRWVRRVTAAPARLRPIEPDEQKSAGAPGVTHVFSSTGDVRIGARLTMPPGDTPPALVITSHGYHVEPRQPLSDDDPWTARSLAVLKVRVRGYPGSRFDTGDLTARDDGYITGGIDSPEDWILAHAVADIINAACAARALVGRATPIMLHGESFGAGLAVIAASLLINVEPIDRLAIALPTFGAWDWRLANPTSVGAGAEIQRLLDADPERAQRITTRVLPLFDAVVHAARVVCPTLCKLALRDEVVPAPTAAAVFNALGADPGHKWRFVVESGHAHHLEGAMPDLRRHAMFERLAGAFLDPSEDLHDLMAAWRDRLRPGPEPA